MLHTIAIRGYRSLREIVLPLRRLTVVTGANGTGKSSLYRALRLLADCGRGEVIGSLAREGGLDSVLWAGPEQLGGARRTGRVEGTTRTGPVALELGFASDDFGYLVDLGLPQMAGHGSLFALDPEIKREVVFAGAVMRTGSTLVRRTRDYVEVSAESGRGFDEVSRSLPAYRSVLAEYAHPGAHPELAAVRHRLRTWRFYDGFRVDRDRAVATAPGRHPHGRAVRRRPRSRRGGPDDHRGRLRRPAARGRRRFRRCDGVGGRARRAVRPPTAPTRHAASAARRRTVRRHTAIPVVGGRAAEPAAAIADGAQRAGDLTAPGSGAAVGVPDPGGRQSDTGRRRHSLAGDARVSWHRSVGDAADLTDDGDGALEFRCTRISARRGSRGWACSHAAMGLGKR